MKELEIEELEKILNNYREPTIQTLDKALHWLATFKEALENLALDEPPLKGKYSGVEMIGIHLFIDNEILREKQK